MPCATVIRRLPSDSISEVVRAGTATTWTQHLVGLTAVGLVMAFGAVVVRGADAENAASSEKRLADAIGFLAADELEGAGIGTAGIDKAAEFLAEQFAALGLNTALYEGTPFQKFKMNAGVSLGERNQLALVRPAGEQGGAIDLQSGEDFTPLSLGGSGKLDLPLVFAGYGITGKDEGYDDYAGIDVEGKTVVILRHEPQQDNPHSAFAGTRDSPLAPMWPRFRMLMSTAPPPSSSAPTRLRSARGSTSVASNSMRPSTT